MGLGEWFSALSVTGCRNPGIMPTGGLTSSAFDTSFYSFPLNSLVFFVWPEDCLSKGVLRITSTDAALVLEGQLAGPFAEELESIWDGAKCVVDLTDVTFVDESGARVLCAMKQAGVRFIAGGVDTK